MSGRPGGAEVSCSDNVWTCTAHTSRDTWENVYVRNSVCWTSQKLTLKPQTDIFSSNFLLLRSCNVTKSSKLKGINVMFLQAGLVHLQWEESSSVVSTCCLDGALRLWDARSGNMVSEYRGHTAEILDFTINRYHRYTLITFCLYLLLLFCALYCLLTCLQGSNDCCDGFRRQPGESLLSPKTWSIKRRSRRWRREVDIVWQDTTKNIFQSPQDF